MTKKPSHDDFASELAARWSNDDGRDDIRTTLRAIKDRAELAYIAAYVMVWLITFDDQNDTQHASTFLFFIHPKNKD